VNTFLQVTELLAITLQGNAIFLFRKQKIAEQVFWVAETETKKSEAKAPDLWCYL